MIKSLKKYQINTVPFTTTKDWQLSNVTNDDLVLTEADEGVQMEYVDYGNGSGYPELNTECLIALEQQEDDKLRFREGQKRTGIFYPDQEPVNQDGTFKRVVYSQIKTLFYNNYKNPTELWGLENIDFPRSKTIKFITDKMRIFDVVPRVLGEKIVENTVHIVDNSIDNNYDIFDDGHNNLFAGVDIFSKVQEVGDFTNEFATGSINNCNTYFDFSVPNSASSLTATAENTASVFLSWIDNSTNELGFAIERSLDSGSTYTLFATVGPNVTGSRDTSVTIFNTYYYRVYAFNSFGNSSFSNTASVTITPDFLFDLTGSLYSAGPYETFEGYPVGGDPGSSGFGWSSAWEIRIPASADYALLVSLDDFSTYTSGSSPTGSVGGWGWSGSIGS